MAAVSTTVLVQGLRGSLGNLVFRTIRGKTFVSQRPQRPRFESPLQRMNRDKFRMAAAWAKCMVLNPEKKVYYETIAKRRKLPNAYTAAVSEYMCRKDIVATAPSVVTATVHALREKLIAGSCEQSSRMRSSIAFARLDKFPWVQRSHIVLPPDDERLLHTLIDDGRESIVV